MVHFRRNLKAQKSSAKTYVFDPFSIQASTVVAGEDPMAMEAAFTVTDDIMAVAGDADGENIRLSNTL